MHGSFGFYCSDANAKCQSNSFLASPQWNPQHLQLCMVLSLAHCIHRKTEKKFTYIYATTTETAEKRSVSIHLTFHLIVCRDQNATKQNQPFSSKVEKRGKSLTPETSSNKSLNMIFQKKNICIYCMYRNPSWWLCKSYELSDRVPILQLKTVSFAYHHINCEKNNTWDREKIGVCV